LRICPTNTMPTTTSARAVRTRRKLMPELRTRFGMRDTRAPAFQGCRKNERLCFQDRPRLPVGTPGSTPGCGCRPTRTRANETEPTPFRRTSDRSGAHFAAPIASKAEQIGRRKIEAAKSFFCRALGPSARRGVNSLWEGPSGSGRFAGLLPKCPANRKRSRCFSSALLFTTSWPIGRSARVPVSAPLIPQAATIGPITPAGREAQGSSGGGECWGMARPAGRGEVTRRRQRASKRRETRT
jgi:hypothetical protein